MFTFFCYSRINIIVAKIEIKEIGANGLVLGCGAWRCLRGEKGERTKINGSPNLSTQPIAF
jgi:hypothetical protein